MNSAKILYVSTLDPDGTDSYRMEALQRIGQQVASFPLYSWEPRSRLLASLRFRYPAGPLIRPVNQALVAEVNEHRPDIVWIDKPIYFTRDTVEAIHRLGCTVVSVNQDNPFGPRRDGCWRQFMKVFPLFDLSCVFRDADAKRYAEWGLPFVQLMFSYEPTQHFAPAAAWSDADRDRGISYTGSPLEERPQFLERLGTQPGIALSVAGPRWDRVWPEALQAKYVTGGMMKGSAYRETIWRSKINLAFVTHANEDDIAHKAVEIAACGQFLLAERSPGHLRIFEEGVEAEFFSSLEECAEKARYYLDQPQERERIAAAGHARAESSGYSNDAQLAKVLERVHSMQGA